MKVALNPILRLYEKVGSLLCFVTNGLFSVWYRCLYPIYLHLLSPDSLLCCSAGISMALAINCYTGSVQGSQSTLQTTACTAGITTCINVTYGTTLFCFLQSNLCWLGRHCEQSVASRSIGVRLASCDRILTPFQATFKVLWWTGCFVRFRFIHHSYKQAWCRSLKKPRKT